MGQTEFIKVKVPAKSIVFGRPNQQVHWVGCLVRLTNEAERTTDLTFSMCFPNCVYIFMAVGEGFYANLKS